MEIENDTDDQAVDDLVAALNAAAGKRRYAAIEEPGDGLFGTDAIKVAMIYQPAAASSRWAGDDDRRGVRQRPVSAGAAVPAGERGQPFWVVVNHFKSKSCGSPGRRAPNADQGDGQGCFNADRVDAGRQRSSASSARSHGPDVMIIGDLNAYGDEDPIDVARRRRLRRPHRVPAAPRTTATPTCSRGRPATSTTPW